MAPLETAVMTIYKFPFKIADRITIMLEDNARILHVEMQGETPCLWALVDGDAPASPWHFRIIGTGHPIRHEEGAGLEYVATFQQPPFVWHLFRSLPVVWVD